jgi:hypothetical protein
MIKCTLHQGQGGGIGALADEIVLSVHCKSMKRADGRERTGADKGVCSRCGLGLMMAKAEAGEDETREYWEGARCIRGTN